MKEPFVRIENWSVGGYDPYQPPECQVPRLHGKVYNHPNHDDGKEVNTSRIHDATFKNGEVYVRTTSRVYLLGEVDPEYEKAYPNAKERMVK